MGLSSYLLVADGGLIEFKIKIFDQNKYPQLLKRLWIFYRVFSQEPFGLRAQCPLFGISN
jgi:hypothetical protein